MNKRTLRILEYNKILTMLTDHASSPMAKRLCDRLKPQRDINVINTLQEETRDALIRLNKQGNLSFSALTDIRAAIKRLEVKGALTIRELLDTAAVIELAAAVKAYGEGDSYKDSEPIEADCLTNRFRELILLEHISSEIRRCLPSNDEVSDDASSTLRSIRRSIKLTNDKLHQQLAKLLKDDATRDKLQENLITTRNGRYCIPVRQEYRGSFPGMIHDQSKSGSTLFIEPMAIVNLNNEIKELANEEQNEIERILENLSLMAAAAAPDIAGNLEILTQLDFIFARAKFARSMNASQPIFNTEGIIDIKAGRHPLLDRHSVVPVDIRLGDNYTLLIITGPNTGGKTVSLKTLGLFTLMGQAGLHIPALDGSKLSVFDNVFADIGDEQSIEQNLSTFSSHMSNIVYIINHASANSLCLFDEPGGGTDPVEGSALAIALLNHLKEMGTRCMATTHYSELKTYALSTPGVENASCEFDVATLQPTYKLMIGVPGKSNAFAISRKLGLPDHIIDLAKGQLDSNAVDMETLIADLEKSKKSIDEERAIAESYRKEAEQLKRRAAEKEESLNAKKAEILKKAREEARLLIEEAKETADTAIRDYNKWRSNPNQADMRKMEEKRSALRSKLKDYDTPETNIQRTSNHTAKDFHLGDTVMVISMNAKGTITGLPDSKGVATVQLGILSSKLPIKDLLIIPDADEKPAKTAEYKGRTTVNKALSISPEINVMGMTVDEAILELDKYLDDAVLAHLSKVTIIHGKGTGALRNGIHKYLKTHPLARTFRAGEYGEGEYGVTIVEL